MTRAPEEVLMIEAMPDVVPAAVTGIIVDDTVRGRELVRRMGETADHHHWYADSPGEPGESAGEPDEELGVFEPAGTLSKRPVAGLILNTVREVIPNKTAPVH